MKLRNMLIESFDWLFYRLLDSRLFEWFLFRVSLLKTTSDYSDRMLRIQFLGYSLSNMKSSVSQLAQDTWVIFKTNGKRNGVFVEVGACEPIRLSNTYLLETEYGWSGVLVEPNLQLCNALENSRSSKVINAAVSEHKFVNLEIATNPEFSRLDLSSEVKNHRLFRSNGEKVSVRGVTLSELFAEASIPTNFDYLSVDVEGFELEVLMTNDWSIWKPKLITVEHNFSTSRELIRNFLYSKGYELASEVSVFAWDDWFCLKESESKG